MKTGMIFPSEEEEWEWFERMAQRREQLLWAVRYTAIFALGISLLVVLLWFGARNMGEKRYDPWQNAIHNVRSQSGIRCLDT